MLRLYLMLFILGTLSGVGYGAYTYYITTQETIRVLTENNVKLELAVATNEEAIASLQSDYAAAMEDYEKFAGALAVAAASRGGDGVYFLICGCKLGVGTPDPRKGWEQCPKDASNAPGISAWRIANDDYMWANVLVNANIYAGIAGYGGHGKFNDP